MPQLSLYLDDATMDILREQARSRGFSLSKWTAETIRASKQSNSWPPFFFDLYGCAKDDDSFVRPDQGSLVLDDDPATFFV